jgi:xylulokinase
MEYEGRRFLAVADVADVLGITPAAVAELLEAGELRGLRLDHEPADVALALVEGLTLSVADCLDAATAVDRVHVCGGGARSDLWCQLIADASGVPVARTGVAEVGAWGAVLHAGVALGHYRDLDAAVADLGRPGREFEPNPAGAERFRERLERLRATR